jgi:hypothetical protein
MNANSDGLKFLGNDGDLSKVSLDGIVPAMYTSRPFQGRFSVLARSPGTEPNRAFDRARYASWTRICILLHFTR